MRWIDDEYEAIHLLVPGDLKLLCKKEPWSLFRVDEKWEVIQRTFKPYSVTCSQCKKRITQTVLRRL
jgi:hypothetical protein